MQISDEAQALPARSDPNGSSSKLRNLGSKRQQIPQPQREAVRSAALLVGIFASYRPQI